MPSKKNNTTSFSSKDITEGEKSAESGKKTFIGKKSAFLFTAATGIAAYSTMNKSSSKVSYSNTENYDKTLSAENFFTTPGRSDLDKLISSDEIYVKWNTADLRTPRRVLTSISSEFLNDYPATKGKEGKFGPALRIIPEANFGLYARNINKAELLFGDINGDWIKVHYEKDAKIVNKNEYVKSGITQSKAEGKYRYGVYVTSSMNPGQKIWLSNHAPFIRDNYENKSKDSANLALLINYYPGQDKKGKLPPDITLAEPVAFNVDGRSYVPSVLADINGYDPETPEIFPFSESKAWMAASLDKVIDTSMLGFKSLSKEFLLKVMKTPQVQIKVTGPNPIVNTQGDEKYKDKLRVTTQAPTYKSTKQTTNSPTMKRKGKKL